MGAENMGRNLLLLVTIYGFVSAGRKWQRASDNLMTESLCLSRILPLNNFLYHSASVATLFIVKYVDKLRIATRNNEWLARALGGIKGAFNIVSNVHAPETITMNSTEVEVSRDTLVLHMCSFQ